MILTCPSCATRFRIDEAVLGAAGRRLKCGRCAHVWFASASEEPQEELVPPSLDIPATEPNVETPRIEQPVEPPPRRRTKPRSGAALPARAGAPGRRRAGGLGWGLAIVMGAVVLAVVTLGREQLVSFWPPAAGVYAGLGFGLVDRPIGDGLELRSIVPSRDEREGVDYLVLDGSVVNVSDDVVVVPPMLAVLRDAASVPLQQWTFRADTETLAPGESALFSTRLADPAEGAADIKVEFTEGVGLQ